MFDEIYRASEELDEDTRRNRKKKILAELFGTEDNIRSPKTESAPVVSPMPIAKNANWLDLKNDDNVDLDSRANDADVHKLSSPLVDQTTGNAEKLVRFNENFDSRRRSESGVSSAARGKLKPSHQSLDLDFNTTNSESKDVDYGRKIAGDDQIDVNDENRSSSVKGPSRFLRLQLLRSLMEFNHFFLIWQTT